MPKKKLDLLCPACGYRSVVGEQLTPTLVLEQAGGTAYHATNGVATVITCQGESWRNGGYRGCDHCT